LHDQKLPYFPTFAQQVITFKEGESEMDSISTAIIAAITAGVADTGKKAFADAYQGLKSLIQSKFGKDNEISKAIVKVEEDPKSEGPPMILSGQVITAKAHQDKELIAAVEVLQKALKETPEGQKVIKKYNIKAEKIGVAGDNTRISGGQNF
jgi:hypothetical protein